MTTWWRNQPKNDRTSQAIVQEAQHSDSGSALTLDCRIKKRRKHCKISFSFTRHIHVVLHLDWLECLLRRLRARTESCMWGIYWFPSPRWTEPPRPIHVGVIGSLLLDVFKEQASIRLPLDAIPTVLGEWAPQKRGGVRRRQPLPANFREGISTGAPSSPSKTSMSSETSYLVYLHYFW
jgi:hypothetical protein